MDVQVTEMEPSAWKTAWRWDKTENSHRNRCAARGNNAKSKGKGTQSDSICRNSFTNCPAKFLSNVPSLIIMNYLLEESQRSQEFWQQIHNTAKTILTEGRLSDKVSVNCTIIATGSAEQAQGMRQPAGAPRACRGRNHLETSGCDLNKAAEERLCPHSSCLWRELLTDDSYKVGVIDEQMGKDTIHSF